MKGLKFIYKYLKKYTFLLILSFIFSLFAVFSLTFIPFMIGKAIDEIDLFSQDLLTSWNDFYFYILVIVALISFLVIFQFLFDYFLGLIVEKVSRNLKNDIFKKYNKVSIEFIDSNLKGDLISRIVNDVDNINTGFLSFFRQLLTGILQIVFTLSMMFYVNWILALLVVTLTPLGFILSYFIAKKSSNYYKQTNNKIGELTSSFVEYVNNLETVEAYNYEDNCFEKFKTINNDLYVSGQKAQLISSFVNPSARLINNIILCVIVICGSFLYIFNLNIGSSVLTIGMISSFIQYTIQYSKPFDGISSCISEAQNAYSSIFRIKEILEVKDDIDEGKDICLTKGDIKLDSVNFGYRKDKLVLKDIDLLIKEGHKIALVGPTGCGKTTIINLLLRFYDPNDGIIKFNEDFSTDILKSNIRNKFGMVLQDTWIFNGTIKENISYGKIDASFEEIKEAANKANCLDFIERLPKGFDTIVSESSGLSAGEKQLISIARVMLMKPDILLLDEATSNIDTRTELKIVEAIQKLSENKTSIIVAHRLSTIVNSDYIVVLKDGKIIEKGNHQELMSLKGFYFNLYMSQFSSFNK